MKEQDFQEIANKHQPVSAIFDALEKFINARPNLDPANYGLGRGQTPDRKQWFECRRVWQAEHRSITQDGTRARKALREARNYPENAAILAESFLRAFSGRLSWNGKELEYCTGQYYPTEYRKAAATVLEYYCHEVKPKFDPPEGVIYTHKDQIIGASERKGSHYFDRETMSFFRSRVLSPVFHGKGGVYFVTSECGPNGRRAFTVRQFNPIDASIDTFGPFNELSREKALRIARIASEYPEAAKEALAA
jgi:hypothetical protein